LLANAISITKNQFRSELFSDEDSLSGPIDYIRKKGRGPLRQVCLYAFEHLRRHLNVCFIQTAKPQVFEGKLFNYYILKCVSRASCLPQSFK
jgi:hypothetical protein